MILKVEKLRFVIVVVRDQVIKCVVNGHVILSLAV